MSAACLAGRPWFDEMIRGDEGTPAEAFLASHGIQVAVPADSYEEDGAIIVLDETVSREEFVTALQNLREASRFGAGRPDDGQA